MCACVHTCVHMRVDSCKYMLYACMCVCVCMYALMCTCMYAYMCAYMYMYMHVCVHVCEHMCMRACARVCARACVCAQVREVHHLLQCAQSRKLCLVISPIRSDNLGGGARAGGRVGKSRDERAVRPGRSLTTHLENALREVVRAGAVCRQVGAGRGAKLQPVRVHFPRSVFVCS